MKLFDVEFYDYLFDKVRAGNILLLILFVQNVGFFKHFGIKSKITLGKMKIMDLFSSNRINTSFLYFLKNIWNPE